MVSRLIAGGMGAAVQLLAGMLVEKRGIGAALQFLVMGFLGFALKLNSLVMENGYQFYLWGCFGCFGQSRF